MALQIESKLAGGGSGPRLRIGSGKRESGGVHLGAGPALHLGGGVYQPEEPANERKVRRGAIAAAIVFHVVLLLVTFPQFGKEPILDVSSGRTVYVVEQVRFKPPQQQPKPKDQKQPPKKKARKIPIPDPTPDDPEPIIDEFEVEVPDLEIDDLGSLVDIPGPPAAGSPGAPGPIYIQGDVQPPRKVHFPQPRYTEEARKARVQGVVILQAIVDADGNVSEVEVVKGLPEGLDESAVETVLGWKYEPALLDGKPVPVYMNLTISFSLQ